MNVDVNPLDMMPAMETTGGEPALTTACCSNCYSSLLLVTNGCEF